MLLVFTSNLPKSFSIIQFLVERSQTVNWVYSSSIRLLIQLDR